jgi:probable HAF family extracellular repeat protein
MRYNVIALLAVVLIIAGSAKALEYQITIIDPAGLAYPYSINDNGQVVGSYNIGAYKNASFFWEDGNLTIINEPVPGYTPWIVTRSINNSGQIVGETDDRGAFILSDGSFTYLQAIHAGYGSWANGINNAGVVAGRAQAYTGPLNRACIWPAGSTIPIDICTIADATYSEARAINDSNEVVGDFSTSSHGTHAFIYDDVNGMRDINVLPGQLRSYGYAINNKSQVAGYSAGSPDGYHAFLYDDSNGVMTDLGTLDGAVDSAAYDISNDGIIAGRSIWADDSAKGCLWVDGQIININDLLYTDLDWTITRARSLSNNGQVVGTGVLNGGAYAILLTPVGHLDYDNDVDLKDFAIFSSLWGRSDCNDLNNWCGNADISRNGKVYLPDLGKLTEHWLEGTE